MPALYALAVRRLLPPRFAIVGVARTDGDDDAFRQDMQDAVKQHARDPFRQDTWDELAAQLHWVTTDFADSGGEDKLHDLVEKLDEQEQLGGNRVFYLAVPPPAFPTIVEALGKRRDERGWTRLVIEKPFGHDLASAEQLTASLFEYFREDEIFRIDHYLGKETVQNMLALRFANGIFEPIWNRQFVDHVQITVAESIGIEARAGYYEHAGAIRDIFQNHLLQLLALTAMEPPIDFTSDSVHNEKVKVLRAMHTPAPRSVVRGQYGRGFIEGEEVAAYREEDGVAPDSMTETFVAAKLYIDNWRWADTPFYVRMGKRLARHETTIAIQFKAAPHPPFEEAAAEGLRPNVLVVHVQPDEGVSLAIGAKVPGQGMTIRTVHMDFLYGGAFRTGMPEAYERLILDTMLGDSTLFTRTDEVEEQWKLVDAIIAGWQRDNPAFPNYPGGLVGSADRRRAHATGRAVVATSVNELSWLGEDVCLADVDTALARLRAKAADEAESMRTSVMTHIAWVPYGWREQARAALAGMAELHPSRTILLFPEPNADDNRIDARAEVERWEVPDTDRGPRDRGGRAHAARRSGEGAGEHRRAAPHLGPAGLLTLARRAALGRAGARATGRGDRPADRRLDRVGRRARLVPAAGGALSALRHLGHRLGENVALALAPGDDVAGDRGGADRARPRDGGAGVAPVRLAALAARAGRDRDRARSGGEARGRDARRRGGAASSRRPPDAERRPLRRARALHSGSGLRGRRARRHRFRPVGGTPQRTVPCNRLLQAFTVPFRHEALTVP